MHFVKKVPTSEEERAAKQKERAIKIKKFCVARDKIFEKRNKGELDDEMLLVTSQLLSKNADIYTFWNIRRETITKMRNEWKQCSTTSESAECKQKCDKQCEDILRAELILTKDCIEDNPKSYSAFFQRGWTLKQMANPDIKTELALCDKLLAYDSRNFHCWDHRRLVSKLGNLPVKEDLEFSKKLINNDPSNFSAWHFRGGLLPKTVDEKTGEVKLDGATFKQEIEKATTAFFTSPSDQSALVYTRWLLGMGSGKDFLKPDSCSRPVPLSITFHDDNTTIVMSKACKLEALAAFVQGASENAKWKAYSTLSNDPDVAQVWQCIDATPLTLVAEAFADGKASTDIKEKPYVNKELLRKAFDSSSSPAHADIQTLMTNIQSLIKEDDEARRSMGPLYVLTLCMMESNPEQNYETIVANLQKLATELDPQRKEVYKVHLSRQAINHALRKVPESYPGDPRPGLTVLERLLEGVDSGLALQSDNITSLDGLELLAGLVLDLNVNGAPLTTMDGILLPNLDRLTLNGNGITRISGVASMPKLTNLNLGTTQVDNVQETLQQLKTLPNLKTFIYAETPLTNHRDELRAALPSIRHIPHWL